MWRRLHGIGDEVHGKRAYAGDIQQQELVVDRNNPAFIIISLCSDTYSGACGSHPGVTFSSNRVAHGQDVVGLEGRSERSQ